MTDCFTPVIRWHISRVRQCQLQTRWRNAALDQLNKYFTIAQMPVVSSNYWNMVHGNTPEEVCQDKEGLQTMRLLGRNMAWLLKCIEAGKNNGVAVPEAEAKVKTNYIR